MTRCTEHLLERNTGEDEDTQQPFISGLLIGFMYLGTFGESIKTWQVKIKESLKKMC